MTEFIEYCLVLGAGYAAVILFVVWAVAESVGLFCNIIK